MNCMNKNVETFILENIEKTTRFFPEDDDTLIGLPYKYTTPCVSEMFLEIYYWDTYFTNVGLLTLGKTELAKSNVDNMLYLVEKYGFMPNGNRTYYLDRSQPPFLSRMVKEIFEVTNDKTWLSSAYSTLTKEYSFWQDNRILENGLNAYTGYEFQDYEINDHYEGFLRRTGYKPEGEVSEQFKLELAKAIMSFNESGWDCNSRFGTDGHNFFSVDLNSLLYDMEENMRLFAVILDNKEEEIWQKRKEERLTKMQLLWNEKENVFIDFNPKTGKYSDYISAASFYPLFCKVATSEQAEKSRILLEKLELKYGISGGETGPLWSCQWDYPNVWAPQQFIAYTALMNYGYVEDARRIAKKYIELIEAGFEKTGNLWEKYNGNTGEIASNEYDAPPMVGWTAGVYIYFYSQLEKNLY